MALDNTAAARQLIRIIFDKTERLAGFPKSRRIPPELPDSVYREVVVPPCRIFYRLAETKILILYVQREERQLRSLMLEKR
nr:type II toxin-antitoxin system RelE/ParE family toxin [Alcanivorax nanhaiticus]